MKKFLYKTTLFLVICLVVLGAIDGIFSRCLQKSNYSSIEGWFDLMHGKIDSDIIVSGSSRAYVMVSPSILDSILGVSTYNLGIDGSPINRQAMKYEMFKARHNRKPKLILQNIDLFAMTYRVGYDNQQYLPYFGNRTFRESAIFSAEPFSFADKYLPLYRYRKYPGLFRYITSATKPRRLYKGFYAVGERTWDGALFNQIEKITFNIDERTVAMFEHYLEDVRADSIKMVFVYAPIYIGLTQKISNLEEMYAYFQQLADKYNTPILDYNYSYLSYDTLYFYNAMHLNEFGTKLFSDTLAKDIKRMGWVD